MDKLLRGYRRFRAESWPEYRRLFEHLADQGQRPRTLVVACADSRVDPAMVFGAGPGELFIVRNVANLVPPYAPDTATHGTSAALEFGVRALEVENLIVLGHGLCGGVHALLEGVPSNLSDFVLPWIGLAAKARERVLACDGVDQQLEGEHAVVRLSIENLRTFPWIAERVDAGQLHLAGAHFDIRFGVLTMLQPDGSFAAVE